MPSALDLGVTPAGSASQSSQVRGSGGGWSLIPQGPVLCRRQLALMSVTSFEARSNQNLNGSPNYQRQVTGRCQPGQGARGLAKPPNCS